MNHDQFREAWKRGEIEISVERSKALRIAGSDILPKRYQYAHLFWSWVWMLLLPGGLAVTCFYRWWAGLLLIIVVMPVVGRATKTSAMQFIIDYAIEDSKFYEWAVREGVIIVRPKP